MNSTRTVRALRPFTVFAGSMIVFNLGDERPLPVEQAARYVESGRAEYVTGGVDIAAAITEPTEPEAPATLSEPAPTVEAEPKPEIVDVPPAPPEPAPKKGRPGRPPKARTTDAPED